MKGLGSMGIGRAIGLAVGIALSSATVCLAQEGLVLGKTGNTCYECHIFMSLRVQQPAEQWEKSIHAEQGVACKDCHGGNPKATDEDGAHSKAHGWIGKPVKRDIPALCARCHSDPNLMRQYNIPTSQYDQYRQSVHGKRLLEDGDENVATCADCHDGHNVRKVSSPESTVFKENLPKTCARCHSDAKLMGKYGLPSDQYDKYVQSYHGELLLKEKRREAPTCADCHGTHGATPPGVKEVSHVCGQCHSLTEQYYNQGPHRQALDTYGSPRCVDCHGNHKILFPSDEMLVGEEKGHCGSCHRQGSKGWEVAEANHREISALAAAIKEAEGNLDTAEKMHMDVRDPLATLEEARTALVEARATQHNLSAKVIGEKTGDGLLLCKEVKASALRAIQASEGRRKNLVAAALACLLMAALVYGKRAMIVRKAVGSR